LLDGIFPISKGTLEIVDRQDCNLIRDLIARRPSIPPLGV